MPPKRSPNNSPGRRRSWGAAGSDAGSDAGTALLPSLTAAEVAAALAPTVTVQAVVVPDSLPLWWLVFVSLYYFPIQLSWLLLGAMMVPTAVQEIVPGDERNARLAFALALGSAMQFAQPLIGAFSDHIDGCGPVMGRRRPFLIAGQLMSCVGLAVMMVAHTLGATLGYWAVAGGYTLYMLGNAVGYGVYPSLIPNHIPEHQRGLASGLQGFMSLLAFVSAATLGVVAGNAGEGGGSASAGSGGAGEDAGSGSTTAIYILLIALNFVCMVVSVISFGEEPGLCTLKPEAQLPPPPLRLSLSPRKSACASACSFFEAFKHRAFSWLFVVMMFGMLSQFVVMALGEMFMHDRVAPHFDVLGHSLTTSAEAAMGIWTLVQCVSSFCVVVPSGVLSAQVGRKKMLGAAYIITASSYLFFVLPRRPSFAMLLIAALVNGLGVGM